MAKRIFASVAFIAACPGLVRAVVASARERTPTPLERKLLEAAVVPARSALAGAPPVRVCSEAQEYELCAGEASGELAAGAWLRRLSAADAGGVAEDAWLARLDTSGSSLGVEWVKTPDGHIRSVIVGTYGRSGQPEDDVAVGLHYCDAMEATTRLTFVDASETTKGTPWYQCSESGAGAPSAAESCPAQGSGSVKLHEARGIPRAWIAVPMLCQHQQFSRPDVLRLGNILENVYRKYQARVYDTTRGSSATYGELTTRGFLQLLDGLPERHRVRPSSVFADVGSGLGKLVLAAILVTSAASARGFEVVPSRAEAAAEAFKEAVSEGRLAEAEAARVDLVAGDAFAEGAGGLAGAGATHVFANALAFDEALSRKLVSAVLSLGENLACFISSKRHDVAALAPDLGFTSPCLGYVKTEHIEMSWNDHVAVHYYCCDGKQSRLFAD